MNEAPAGAPRGGQESVGPEPVLGDDLTAEVADPDRAEDNLGVGVAVYGLPLGPAVIIAGTLIWSLGEIIGGPSTFAYPGLAGPGHLKAHYIGSFQFMFGLGTAVGPVVGGWLFIRLGHGVWPVLALGSLIATTLAVLAVRKPPAAPAQPEAQAEAPALATT